MVNFEYNGYAENEEYDDYIAGVLGYHTYAAWKTLYWQIVGEHEFEDYDFMNLHAWTNDDLQY